MSENLENKPEDPVPELENVKEPNMYEAAKTNYFIVKNTIDHKEEPIEALKELLEFVYKVIEDPTILEKDKEFKDFFYQDCALGLLKRMNKERSADPKVSASI